MMIYRDKRGQRREIARENMVREDLYQRGSALGIVRYLRKALGVVFLVANDAPYLDISVTNQKIGAFRAFPSDIPGGYRMNFVGDTTLGKPSINGIFPLRIHDMSIWTLSAAAKTRPTDFNALPSKPIENNREGNAKAYRDAFRRFARFVTANDYINWQFNKVRGMSYRLTRLFGRLYRFGQSKICTIGAYLNTGFFQAIQNPGGRHPDFVGYGGGRVSREIGSDNMISMRDVLKHFPASPFAITRMRTEAGKFGTMALNIEGGVTPRTNKGNSIFSHKFNYTSVAAIRQCM